MTTQTLWEVKMSLKKAKDMNLGELLERFRRDIKYDAHAVKACYGRSEAAKELLERASHGTIMQDLLSYFHISRAIIDDELKWAWSSLIRDMCIRMKYDMGDSPDDRDLSSWRAWAEAQGTVPEKSGT